VGGGGGGGGGGGTKSGQFIGWLSPNIFTIHPAFHGVHCSIIHMLSSSLHSSVDTILTGTFSIYEIEHLHK